MNGSLCVFVEELGLLYCFLEHYCTHPMLSCLLRSLYECQRLLTRAFHCGKRVYEIESILSPCQILVCGSVKDFKPNLEMDYSSFCGYNKPPISGQHSLMFDSCCSIAHRLNAPSSQKAGGKIGCFQPCFQRDFCPYQNHSNLPRHFQIAPVCKNAGAELHLQSC